MNPTVDQVLDQCGDQSESCGDQSKEIAKWKSKVETQSKTIAANCFA